MGQVTAGNYRGGVAPRHPVRRRKMAIASRRPSAYHSTSRPRLPFRYQLIVENRRPPPLVTIVVCCRPPLFARPVRSVFICFGESPRVTEYEKNSYERRDRRARAPSNTSRFPRVGDDSPRLVADVPTMAAPVKTNTCTYCEDAVDSLVILCLECTDFQLCLIVSSTHPPTRTSRRDAVRPSVSASHSLIFTVSRVTVFQSWRRNGRSQEQSLLQSKSEYTSSVLSTDLFRF